MKRSIIRRAAAIILSLVILSAISLSLAEQKSYTIGIAQFAVDNGYTLINEVFRIKRFAHFIGNGLLVIH